MWIYVWFYNYSNKERYINVTQQDIGGQSWVQDLVFVFIVVQIIYDYSSKSDYFCTWIHIQSIQVNQELSMHLLINILPHV